MGRLIVSTQITLDGVMDSQDKWFQLDWHSTAGKVARDQLHATSALLMGRKNYQGLSAVWPTITDEVGYAERVNAMPKFVASRTLQGSLEWNARLLQGDVAKRIRELKEETHKNLLVNGCGDFTNFLLDRDLIDELLFWVHPVVWGQGARPFPGRVGLRLELMGSTTFDHGVTLLTYRTQVKEASVP